MFENVGGKIKALSIILSIVGTLGLIIYGLFLMSESFVVGVLVIILGSLYVWICSLFICGFGEIIEQLEISNGNTYEIYQLLKKLLPEEENKEETKKSYLTPPAPTVKKTLNGGWICSKCSTENSGNNQFCKECGTYK